MTLSLIHWVTVQDKGSKIPCEKFGAMKIIQSDWLHQEYLTIDLGNTTDWRQLQLLLVRLCEKGAEAGQHEQTGGETRTLAQSLTHSVTYWVTHPPFFFRKCWNKSNRLPIHVSGTAANSQDGSSLEFVAATADRECNIQDAMDGGLCPSWDRVVLRIPTQSLAFYLNINLFTPKRTYIRVYTNCFLITLTKFLWLLFN